MERGELLRKRNEPLGKREDLFLPASADTKLQSLLVKNSRVWRYGAFLPLVRAMLRARTFFYFSACLLFCTHALRID